MDDSVRFILQYCVVPLILGVVTYFMKSYLERLHNVERSLHNKLEEEDVRQLLVDKLEPLREDVQELKQKLDKIVDILLKK